MITDFEIYDSDEEPATRNSPTISQTIQGESIDQMPSELRDDFDHFLDPDLTVPYQAKKADPLKFSYPVNRVQKPITDNKCLQRQDLLEKHYHINHDTFTKLKESTRKLLCVLDEIQAKTHSKHLFPNASTNLSVRLEPIPKSDEPTTIDLASINALKRLEDQTYNLDSIYVQDEDDDCSVYKRLTRKCNCLNQIQYNDFVIHFNEDTKYRTSIAGEIIKNMRILKKFLYMSGGYTKKALLFLIEGLSESTHAERVEIIQGCAHADICNIFDEHSIVILYISWSVKNNFFGDSVTQALTADFLHKLARLEEGRRYLHFSSKIINDIKKVLRKKSAFLDNETVEMLNATLSLLIPPLNQNLNVNYYCKPTDEGIGKKTIQTLLELRQNMTFGEIFTRLDLLQHLSNRDNGRTELIGCIPTLIELFTSLLLEFDNSEMNILITNILNNILSKQKESESSNGFVIADVATEPIQMKNQANQIPIKKNNKKRSKLNFGMTPNKFRNSSRRKVSDRQSSRAESLPNCKPSVQNRSQKFTKGLRDSIIVVPVEE